MRKYRGWYGVDASNEESLFEYGFLVRWNGKKQMYDTIFVIGYNDDCNPSEFVFDTWDAQSWREDLQNDVYDLKGLADMCGMDADTYLDETSDVNLLNDILHYYGTIEVVDYYTRCVHTEQEVRKRLNKALTY